MSDGGTGGWRRAELSSRSVGQPSRVVVRGKAFTIHSSIVRAQYDPSTLLISVHPQRDAVRVAPRGELDLANAGTLQAQLDELRDAGFGHLVLDLRGLTFIDSSAVRLILREDRIYRSSGRRFSLIRGAPAVQRVLDISGLTQQLDFGKPLATTPPGGRVAPIRAAGPARPSLGLAFQCYLAQLRQQDRATSRRRQRTRGRT